MASPTEIHQHVIERGATLWKPPHAPDTPSGRLWASEYIDALQHYDAAVLRAAMTELRNTRREGWFPSVAEVLEAVRTVHAKQPGKPQIATDDDMRKREVERWLDNNADRVAGCEGLARRYMLEWPLGTFPMPGTDDDVIEEWRAEAERVQKKLAAVNKRLADSLRAPKAKRIPAHMESQPIERLMDNLDRK